jgi:hypothetical protein
MFKRIESRDMNGLISAIFIVALFATAKKVHMVYICTVKYSAIEKNRILTYVST